MEENKQEEKVVTQVFTKEDIEANKTMAILAYIIWLIPFFGAKESKFAMYHAKQGLILFLGWLAGWVILRISFSIFVGGSIYSYWSTTARFLGFLSMALWVAYIIFAVIGIMNASKGEAKELPIIGKYAKKF
jgi:uncharacterized membrane protein